VTDLCLARFPPVVQHERPPPARVDIEGLINFVRNAPISHRTAFQKWGGSRNTGATARHDLKLPSECSGHLLKLSCSISRRVAARSQDRQRAPSVRWRAGRGTMHLPSSRGTTRPRRLARGRALSVIFSVGVAALGVPTRLDHRVVRFCRVALIFLRGARRPHR
jgi:hypothetical protein